jgi:phosphoribosyl-AMP cyclohydrolase / phosphoribosyl-ATP pyrophosphohydrolase
MTPDFNKYTDGLVPAIIQDAQTFKVLMQGFMNEAAYLQTLDTGRVCFYSRSKQRLWVKGESSGNFLEVQSVHLDCDQDSLLIKALPIGPVCHTGADTCFDEVNRADYFLPLLEKVIADRKANPTDASYTASLFAKGINKIAQKVGEEAVELVIEAKDNNKDLFLGEAADLLYHFLVLLQAKGSTLAEVEDLLRLRHGK